MPQFLHLEMALGCQLNDGSGRQGVLAWHSAWHRVLPNEPRVSALDVEQSVELCSFYGGGGD